MKTYVPSFRIVVKGAPLQCGETVDVMSLTVTETINQPDSFSFALRDRHPTPGRLFAGGEALQWIDSDVLAEYSPVEIYLGYVDLMPLMLRGEITATSVSFPASGQPTVTVQGQSLYAQLQRETRRKPFDSASDSEIAAEIARQLDLQAQVDDTGVKHDLVSLNGEKYASFLRKRAERLNYEVTVKDKTLYFQKRAYLASSTPALTLEWGRDLISFSPRLSTHGSLTEVTVRGPQTSEGRGKEPLVGTARAGDEQGRMGDQTGSEIAAAAGRENTFLVQDHDVATAQEANDMARAKLEAQSLDLVTGSGSCQGNPNLRSRTVIELKGLGRKFSGKYYVTSTTHTIDSSGYRTTFNVKRNAR